MFKPGELPLFDELRHVSDVVEGLTGLLIHDSLLLHLEHRDVHDLADCGLRRAEIDEVSFRSQRSASRIPLPRGQRSLVTAGKAAS